MRAAHELLQDMIQHVAPPKGCSITVMERRAAATEPNWEVRIAKPSAAALSRYQHRRAELLVTDPQIDWSTLPLGVKSQRRVVRWLEDR